MVRHERTTFVSVSWEKKANFFTKAKGYLVNHKLLTRLAFNKKKKKISAMLFKLPLYSATTYDSKLLFKK